MKTLGLYDMNSAQLALIEDSLRFAKVGQKPFDRKLIEMVEAKVKEDGQAVELDGMELKIISRGLLNKAQVLTAAHGINAKKREKTLLYNLAYTISCRLQEFQDWHNPLKQEETLTAGTVNAS